MTPATPRTEECSMEDTWWRNKWGLIRRRLMNCSSNLRGTRQYCTKAFIFSYNNSLSRFLNAVVLIVLIARQCRLWASNWTFTPKTSVPELWEQEVQWHSSELALIQWKFDCRVAGSLGPWWNIFIRMQWIPNNLPQPCWPMGPSLLLPMLPCHKTHLIGSPLYLNNTHYPPPPTLFHWLARSNWTTFPVRWPSFAVEGTGFHI